MIMALHASRADAEILAAVLGCPGCGQPLAPWGYARTRSVRGHSGTVELRPRRVRCRDCRTTHVVLPAWCLPRRAVTVEVIGAALLAKVNGSSHRTIAADLGVPERASLKWPHLEG